MTDTADIVIVGGGIVGLASALALVRRGFGRITVLEAESRTARHQTGHNSGVIHSGLYYKPGSLKAVNCATGREALYRFCREQGIPYEACGKVVVALDEEEAARLKVLHERGVANGLTGLEWLNREQLQEREPFAAGIAALWVPQTGIVDFKAVAEAYARLFLEYGGTIQTGWPLDAVEKTGAEMLLHSGSRTYTARHLINCGGLFSDRIARMCGVDPGLMIIPFRGEYYQLREESRHRVRNLIYPVPDPRFPFLGVHFTRMIGGGVEAGPNAVLALARKGYSWRHWSVRDMAGMISYRGFWKMSRAHWRTGFGEMHRSLSKKAFVKALRRLMPALTSEDLVPGGAGVRAQAVLPDGSLVDDFRILQSDRMIHVLNAPSPAATSSLSIGAHVADRAAGWFPGS